MEKVIYLVLALVGLVVAAGIIIFNFLPEKVMPESAEEALTDTMPVPGTDTEETEVERDESALRYNTGSTHLLPGTDTMMYENKNLGVRFGYPSSWGKVTVEEQSDQFFFLFGEDEQLVMALLREMPEAREGYWGDLGYAVTEKNYRNICSKYSSDTAWQNAWVESADCKVELTTEGHPAVIFEGSWDSFRQSPVDIKIYVLPHETSLYTALVASDERIIDSPDAFENPTQNFVHLVNSIEFFQDPIPVTE